MTGKVALELNSRMPYSKFNWAAHQARVSRLTWEERGLFDAIRCELWTVVGVRMPAESLMTRLRIAEGSPEGRVLETFQRLGLLLTDDEGNVYDEVQAFEFNAALEQSKVNSLNGRRGGRPRKEVVPPAPDRSEF